MKFAIVDLDGTICDDRHRQHLIKDFGPDRFDEYHSDCHLDALMNVGCVFAAQAIIIFTARPERCRELTERWLEKRGIKPYQMLMRADDDFSSSVDLKQRFLQETMRWVHATSDKIVVAFDDRKDILAMYRRNGIPTVRVTYERET